AVTAVADAIVLRSGTDPAAPTITVDGVDVSDPVRGAEVTVAVSAVSAVSGVRRRLVAQQRELVEAASSQGGIVVEGRDVGSVVLPHAQVKIFLTADVGARAQRRTAQDGARGAASDVVRADLDRRDRLDSSRQASPLVRADDAVNVDTTDLTLQQVVDRVVGLVRAVAMDGSR
ncbi:MAG: (d)CMP kinase, partial [Actinomycetota bacterium]|nr:(d)CMP kinase [Actinomycetota bacterium]